MLCLATRSSVLLISRIAELEQELPPGRSPALAAGSERAVPVMRTVVTTAAVLVPAVILGGRAGLESLRPFAVAVLGGLVTMTIVTLVVLPALDQALANWRRPRQPEHHALTFETAEV